jgi:branched-subunit amino acid ABC-type transport system permease component
VQVSAFLVEQFLNGLSYAALLFLLASGLTIIFGLMNVINLAHGSFFMVGAYVGVSAAQQTGSFTLAVLLGGGAGLVVGILIETLFLNKLYRRPHLDQVLLTLGLIYIIGDLVRWRWGAGFMSLSPPSALDFSIPLFDAAYPVYRLFVAAVGMGLALVLWLAERHTIYGAIVRAGVLDPEMVAGVGIDVRRVFLGVFALGAMLAGTAGVLGAPIIGIYQGIDAAILITSLIVVVIGGLGTLAGSFWGSLIVGMAQTFGSALLPKLAMFFIFAVMALVLLFRPQGLLGRKVR